MRALFALAALLGTTVAALTASLSAQEFARWRLWMAAEQAGPEWAVRRHAELMAAAHNSGRVERQGGALFTVADFMPPDPWAVPRQATPQQLKALHDAWIAELER